jgi:phospholipid/cholesterol/gamma-HCH transport system ATP-binding protein
MQEQPTEILVEGLHKAFKTNQVLKGVDLEIRRGELVAFVGGSGCGKTVLLQHIIGHLMPDQGRVLVADHEAPGAPLVDLAHLDEDGLDHLRVHFGVVFQRNALFSASVYENIALSLREIKRLDEEAIQGRVRDSLDAVGFKGDDSVQSRQRHELSGGMAKRVAVARALAMDPILMFYDEPTTGLDPTNAFHVHDLIMQTHQRTLEGGIAPTTIIVTHDKDLLYRLEPRVVMLHEGGVYFDGPYEDFHKSESPIILPYFEQMPVLQSRPVTI